MIIKILNAFGMLAGELIEEYLTKVTRDDLLVTIDRLKGRVQDLEEELDQTVEAYAQLRCEMFDVENALAERAAAAKGKDPDPYDPYSPDTLKARSGCQKEDCIGRCYWCNGNS